MFYDKLGLKGHVKIFQVSDNSKLLIRDYDNLIVYTGREWVLTRLTGIDNDQITATKATDVLQWISFGDGGAPSGDPYNPTPPQSTDESISEIVLDSSDTNLYEGKRIPLNNEQYSSTFQYLQDPAIENRYLMLRCAALINENQANDQDINEAALWISDSNDAASATRFALFAHITFPTFKKTSNLKYLLEWIIHS